ncbi:polyribonucleotide nucleotidyltransferase [Candidatus Omnitrophota bacterium]
MKPERLSVQFGKEELIIETGKLAKLAAGSVTVQYGGTVVLVATCMGKEPKPNMNFLPLTVEYKEKTYAAGRIPGGFFKREGRPSENEILSARLIDRPIRPLFPKGLSNEIQVMAMVLSSDAEYDPDILAVIGASAALSISKIPFAGPIGACRVGRIDGELILNPTYEQREKSEFDLVVVGSKDILMMLEGNAKEVKEDVILEAIAFGHKNLATSIALQEDLMKRGAEEKAQPELRSIDEKLYAQVEKLAASRLQEICGLSQKEEQDEATDLLTKQLIEQLVPADTAPAAEDAITEGDVKEALHDVEQKVIRNYILDKKKRTDGRDYNTIRPITCEVGVLPRTHGSSIFTRGQTQSLAVVTLGTNSDEQMIEALEGKSYKTFMLHYNFPPFSVGETRPIRGPGRREIGHGALAERSLIPVIPSKENFPYTVRVVSEILESNGSSSMATVCAVSLSLMDAGVPISAPVAGIAIGLVKEGNQEAILTDIAGSEDHFGDMDFKIVGTKDGITAIQLDMKVMGLSKELLANAIEEARRARLSVLENMLQVIGKPRDEISELAPRITTLKIATEKIGGLIGPGGKTIRKIIADTGVTIDIEDDGTVMVASTDSVASDKALAIIRSLTEDIEVNRIYDGTIKKVTNFGAFCEIAPNKDGLIHVSELSDKYVKSPEGVVSVGDKVRVKVIGIDDMGRINLSKKQVDKESAK